MKKFKIIAAIVRGILLLIPGAVAGWWFRDKAPAYIFIPAALFIEVVFLIAVSFLITLAASVKARLKLNAEGPGGKPDDEKNTDDPSTLTVG